MKRFCVATTYTVYHEGEERTAYRLEHVNAKDEHSAIGAVLLKLYSYGNLYGLKHVQALDVTDPPSESE